MRRNSAHQNRLAAKGAGWRPGDRLMSKSGKGFQDTKSVRWGGAVVLGEGLSSRRGKPAPPAIERSITPKRAGCYRPSRARFLGPSASPLVGPLEALRATTSPARMTAVPTT